jgi:hypothetical protein
MSANRQHSLVKLEITSVPKLVCNLPNFPRELCVSNGVGGIAFCDPTALSRSMNRHFGPARPLHGQVTFGSDEQRNFGSGHFDLGCRDGRLYAVQLSLKTHRLVFRKLKKLSAGKVGRAPLFAIPNHPIGDALSRQISHGSRITWNLPRSYTCRYEDENWPFGNSAMT